MSIARHRWPRGQDRRQECRGAARVCRTHRLARRASHPNALSGLAGRDHRRRPGEVKAVKVERNRLGRETVGARQGHRRPFEIIDAGRPALGRLSRRAAARRAVRRAQRIVLPNESGPRRLISLRPGGETVGWIKRGPPASSAPTSATPRRRSPASPRTFAAAFCASRASRSTACSRSGRSAWSPWRAGARSTGASSRRAAAPGPAQGQAGFTRRAAGCGGLAAPQRPRWRPSPRS